MRSPFWRCEACGAQNHELDSACQFCEAHEHATAAADYNAAAPEGPQKCSRCGETYGEIES
jgi:hypothetical protein